MGRRLAAEVEAKQMVQVIEGKGRGRRWSAVGGRYDGFFRDSFSLEPVVSYVIYFNTSTFQ